MNLMLISMHGLSFLEALPPTQLLGLMGAGWSGNDAHWGWGLDPSTGRHQGGADSQALLAESKARLPAHVSCPWHVKGTCQPSKALPSCRPTLHGSAVTLPAPAPLPAQILA